MTAINYLWNPLNDNIVEEFDDSGNTVAEYTTEPEEFGNVVSQNRSGDESFFHYDSIGSTLAVTDSGGMATCTRAYSAFGENTEQLGGGTLPFCFVGRKGYYAAEDIQARRRCYSEQQGSWLSTDPVSHCALDECIIGPYNYSRNNPVSYSDPSGLLYGNYCGPLRIASCPPGSGAAPIDDLDALCEAHDCCIGPLLYRCWIPGLVLYCDQVLCIKLTFGPIAKICASSPSKVACIVAAETIRQIMCRPGWGTTPGVFPW